MRNLLGDGAHTSINFKQFEGCERKYIKDDYLRHKEVLEYVLYKLLATTNYYELDPFKACLDLLNEYKEFNDPVRAFMAEVMGQLAWDLVPNQFFTSCIAIGIHATSKASQLARVHFSSRCM